MQKIVFIILLVLPVSFFGQEVLKDTVNFHTFGLRLVPDFSGFGQFYVVYKPADGSKHLTEGYSISRRDFFLQAKGEINSEANLTRKNLFKYYGLDSAKAIYAINNLWRLRYAEYPYRTADSTANLKGWAGREFSPSEAQMEILRSYGIQHINDLIIGENLFRLLKDVSNPAWQQNYINSK